MNRDVQEVLQRCANDERFLDVNDPNYGKAPGIDEMLEDLFKIIPFEYIVRTSIFLALTFWIAYLIFSFLKMS